MSGPGAFQFFMPETHCWIVRLGDGDWSLFWEIYVVCSFSHSLSGFFQAQPSSGQCASTDWVKMSLLWTNIKLVQILQCSFYIQLTLGVKHTFYLHNHVQSLRGLLRVHHTYMNEQNDHTAQELLWCSSCKINGKISKMLIHEIFY